jgi:hypothetical protein
MKNKCIAKYGVTSLILLDETGGSNHVGNLKSEKQGFLI